MSEYVLLTKFWNEIQRIPELVESIIRQTRKPIRWLLIDDGSTDGSGDFFFKIVKESGIIPIISKMPQKSKGNLDTLGRAYTHAFNEHKDALSKLNPDYLAMVDVDTKLPERYFEHMSRVMDSDQTLGCINVHIKGERKRSDWPRGSGKLTKWIVIKQIDGFWDLDADSYLNIKAQSLGLRTKVLDDFSIEAEPSHLWSKKGRFRFGRLNYYTRKHPLLVLQMALRFLYRREHSTAYLRGYFQELFKGTWRCKDKDVQYFYSLEFRIQNKLKRVIGLGILKWHAVS